jgi:hypothetical protein
MRAHSPEMPSQGMFGPKKVCALCALCAVSPFSCAVPPMLCRSGMLLLRQSGDGTITLLTHIDWLTSRL